MFTMYKNIFKNIKYMLTIGFVITLWSISALAQTDLKIGNSPGAITASSVFEAASTTKGILIPRMTTAQMNAISSPANGLMIYNTTDGCIYVYRTSVWLSTCSPTYAMAWGLLGNSGTVDGTNFIGTTDNIPFNIQVNSQKAGRIDHLLLNTFLGYQASNGNTTGTGNTTMGYRVLNANTTGSNNTALGTSALFTNTNAWGNTAVGYRSLYLNTTGGSNVAIGDSALSVNSTAGRNTAVGYRAGLTLGTGSNNTFLGYGADVSSAALTNATALGYSSIVGASNSLVLGSTGANAVNVGINTTTPQYKLDIDAQTGSTGNPLRLLGLNAGATSDSIISSSSGILRRLSIAQVIGNSWNILGNSGIVDGTNFIGTTDNVPLTFRVNNTQAGRLDHILGNTYLGHQAGTGNTTGTNNVAMGAQAALTNSTGTRNVVLGYQAGRNGAAFDNSILIGYQAGATNAANNNVFMGSITGASNSTGADNIGIGYAALFMNNTGSNNIAIGTSALATKSNGWGNTAVGFRSAFSTMTGQANVAIGDSSLYNNLAGSNNTTIGYQAGSSITTGSSNIAIGTGAQVPTATASNQLSIGNWIYGVNGLIGINTTTPSYKLDIDANTSDIGNPLRLQGLQAGAVSDSIVSSSSGILRRLSIAQIIGSGAWLTTGNASTVDGTNFLGTTDNIPFSIKVNNQKAGRIDHLLLNTFLGYQASNGNTTGTGNSIVGYQALNASTTGSNNTALGTSALFTNTNAWGNTALGYRALYLNSTGGSNVAIGDSALSVNSTGGNNAALGYRAGLTSATGSNNTFLGATSDVSSAALTNATAVGFGASVTASNKIRLGNTSVTVVETSGNFVTVSDRRLKTNINDNYIGLNFIKAIRPVNYELKSQKGIVYDGFVAQEIDSILQKQNIKTFSGIVKPVDTEGYYTVSYATFVVPLVNAVKELDAKSEAAKKENADLKAELERMKAENAALKANVDKNTQDIEAIKAALKKQ